jgi:hypothetical protein
MKEYIKKRINDLDLWIWERSDRVMKGLKIFLITAIVATIVVFMVNFISEHRSEGLGLIFPMIIILFVPFICGGLLLFAWNLTEQSRENQKLFRANCFAWVLGFIFLGGIMLIFRVFSLSSFSISSPRASIWELFLGSFCALIGFLFFKKIRLYSDKAPLPILIFFLVAASSTLLYSYYCLPIEKWLTSWSTWCFVGGGVFHEMIKPLIEE